MNFADDLKRLHACSNAVAWVGNRTLAEAWTECDRPEWLLWLAGRQAGRPLEGQVVRTLASGERLLFLPTLALDTAVRAPGCDVGDHVQVTVRNVHPGRGLLELAVTPT